MSLKKLLLSGICSAFALVAFMLENLFPPLFIVGGRIGIANFFVLIAGITVGFWHGLCVVIIKCVLGSIFTGNVGAVMYSLPSGIVAYSLQMALLMRLPKISVIATSITGGVINSCLQNVIFCIITFTPEYAAYLPFVTVAGAIGGAIVGAALFTVIKLMPEKILKL